MFLQCDINNVHLSDCCSSLSRDINDTFGVENVRKSERMGDKYPKISKLYNIFFVFVVLFQLRHCRMLPEKTKHWMSFSRQHVFSRH